MSKELASRVTYESKLGYIISIFAFRWTLMMTRDPFENIFDHTSLSCDHNQALECASDSPWIERVFPFRGKTGFMIVLNTDDVTS